MKLNREIRVYLYVLLIVLICTGLLLLCRTLFRVKHASEHSQGIHSQLDVTHDEARKKDTDSGEREPGKKHITDDIADIDALIHAMEREQRMDIRLHLDEVLIYDKEIASRHDISDEKLALTPTNKLAEHFVASPMRIWFGMYDNRNMGITRAIRGSRTLNELFGRTDVLEGIMKVYSDTPIEVDKMESKEPGLISMMLMHSDEFLLYPLVFPKTKGHEKELLELLCDRYERMTRVNNELGEKAPYGAVFNTTRELSLRLLESFDSRAYAALKNANETELFHGIKELISVK